MSKLQFQKPNTQMSSFTDEEEQATRHDGSKGPFHFSPRISHETRRRPRPRLLDFDSCRNAKSSYLPEIERANIAIVFKHSSS